MRAYMAARIAKNYKVVTNAKASLEVGPTGYDRDNKEWWERQKHSTIALAEKDNRKWEAWMTLVDGWIEGAQK